METPGVRQLPLRENEYLFNCFEKAHGDSPKNGASDPNIFVFEGFGSNDFLARGSIVPSLQML